MIANLALVVTVAALLALVAMVVTWARLITGYVHAGRRES